MKVLAHWLRAYLPGLSVSDRELAAALTLRGIAVEGIFDLGPDNGSLFEMDITTNRVDAMNHYGIAREAAAIYSLPLIPLDGALPAPCADPSPIQVAIEAPEGCGRFTARAMCDVRIRPSSGIVADRFHLLEQKLIWNAVDATNYVTLAIGHPTHAFDRDKLEGGIIVRRARKGEKLRTLDGVERVLDPDDLVVADEKKALSLAGVIGGWETMITPETRNVLIEAAWFDPLTVRRASKRHGLHTDASHRFERGADFAAPPLAGALVAQQILLAGGCPQGELIDVMIPEAAARTMLRPAVRLRHAEVRRILGASVDGRGVGAETFERVLEALGCSLEKEREGEYLVSLPGWRLDLEREIDLIEEIARIYGYDRFADTLPAFSGAAVAPPEQAKQAVLRRTMLALGWNEAVSSTFSTAADAELYAPQPGRSVPLGNPLSEEAGMLRPSLIPGMLSMMGNNLNRNINDVQLFEIGTVFSGDPHRVEERPALAVGAAGAVSSGPHQPAHDLGFYDLKGVFEELLGGFAVPSLYFAGFAADAGIAPEWLEPSRSACAVVDGEVLAWFGQLHRGQGQRRKLRQAVFVGELYLDRLYRLPLRQPVCGELSRFQPVERDFSFVFPASVRWSEIAGALDGLRIAELVRYAPREILHGGTGGAALPPGHFSLLLGVTFQAAERTLRDEELQSYSQSVMRALETLGGKQRT